MSETCRTCGEGYELPDDLESIRLRLEQGYPESGDCPECVEVKAMLESIDPEDPFTWPTGEQLDRLPSIESGWTDELVFVDDPNEPRLKVWSSRLTAADGANYSGEITIETRTGSGPWVQAAVYNPRYPFDYVTPGHV